MENDGPSKNGGGVEFAGLENDGLESDRQENEGVEQEEETSFSSPANSAASSAVMYRHCKYLRPSPI